MEPLCERDYEEGPGAAVALAYLMMILLGLVAGVGIGWVVWG